MATELARLRRIVCHAAPDHRCLARATRTSSRVARARRQTSSCFMACRWILPGTTTRILRFTNIRVNANGAGIAQANQTSLITMSIASAGNSTLQISCSGPGSCDGSEGPVSAARCLSNTSFAQCISQAKGLLTASRSRSSGPLPLAARPLVTALRRTIVFTTGYATPNRPLLGGVRQCLEG